MTVPHHFPSLIDGPAQVALIAGAGLSCPELPIVNGLIDRIKEFACSLDISVDNDRKDEKYFYTLAEEILKELKKGGKSDSESRLLLAESLGMLDDRRWFGEAGLPLSGNTPRHRVLARFVVEKRIRAIVSLNWDALLEAALDSIGLKEGSSLSRPWDVTEYTRVVDATHMPLRAHANAFPVVKPHGCVRELVSARKKIRQGEPSGKVTFKLTASEMDEIAPDQQNVVGHNVENFISECPLIGVGWKATEDYLRNAIVDIAQQVQRTEPDPFTLIDLKWNDSHTEIANAYGKNESESFAQVSIKTNPSTDCIMLWLQARFALKLMIGMSPATTRAPLEKLLQELDQPRRAHAVLSWADSWLPTWVRVCWRAGAMRGVDPQTNRPIGPFEIPVSPRDAYIPLTGMSQERNDLHAAARLLLALPAPLGRFNFDKYRGGILDEVNLHLYIPLPGWKADVPSSDLSALKPLVDALKGLGYVNKIFLVWLNNQGDSSDLTLRQTLEAQFRRLLPLIGFAAGDLVSWIELEELGRI